VRAVGKAVGEGRGARSHCAAVDSLPLSVRSSLPQTTTLFLVSLPGWMGQDARREEKVPCFWAVGRRPKGVMHLLRVLD
jgi:hypothetical protein